MRGIVICNSRFAINGYFLKPKALNQAKQAQRS
jgi:hypothetical protein